MIRKNFMQKFISLFTAFCFTLAFAGQNLLWASAESLPAGEFKNIFENISRIPAEYGKITSVNDFASKSVVVNIQDLHNHPQAQRHISRIIESLNEHYNVKEIYVEGAYGKIDASWLMKIENNEIKNTVIEEMFAQGRLGGVEYYDIKNSSRIPLYGLEDEKSHKENIARLGYILENRPKYEKVLKEIKKESDYLEAKYANGRNKRFKRTLDKYKSGKISSEKFYSIVEKYVKNIAENPQQYGNILPIKMSDYPNAQKYSLLTRQNSKIDAKRVYSQLQYLLGILKEKLPYAQYKTLLEETENLSDIDSLSFFLADICARYGIDLNARSKELSAFFEMQNLSRSINPVKMIYEERTLGEKLRIALSDDRAESETAFLSDFYDILSDYLNNKLLPEDFTYFSEAFPKFRELYAKYAVNDSLKIIENDFRLFNAYYGLNNQRNTIFINNILKNRDLRAGKENMPVGRPAEECLKEAEDVIIAVTGGYHSKGFQELLGGRKITNVVITPSITSGTEKSDDLYEKIVKMQNSFEREALALTIASQAAKAEQFDALANAGIKFLKNAGYSKENVDLLFKELANAAGGDFVKDTVFAEDETRIEFVNGGFITIENDEGRLSVKESFFDAQASKPELIFSNKEIFSVSASLTESLINDSAAFLKGNFKIVYGLIKTFFQFAYDNNFNGFSFSEGITSEIEDALGTFAKGRFSIDGADKAVIARMPSVLQNFMLNQAINNDSVVVYDGDEATILTLKKEPQKPDINTLLSDFNAFFENISKKYEESEALLRDYILAIKKGKESGYQKGALIDLRGVKKEIILVGDIHAREDNLEEILKSNNNEEKIKKGEAVIVFLGDIIHREDADKLSETESSLSTMERIMRLKIASPENVYLLLGNHDFIDIDAGKGSVNQGRLYREFIEAMGMEYANLYREAAFESALVAVGDTFAAAHAGPVRKADLDKNPDISSFLQTAGIIENFNERLVRASVRESDIIYQLTWNRISSGKYSQNDVNAFLTALGVKGSLIVGHTPSLLKSNEWHTLLGDSNNHEIIFAAKDNFGYASIAADGKKDFITVAGESALPEPENTPRSSGVYLDEANDFKLINIVNFLSKSEKLMPEDLADILLLCGNATVDTFKESLEIYKRYKDAGQELKILISGGFGRLTLDVLKEAVKLGIEVPVSSETTIKTEEEYNNLIDAIKNGRGEIDDAKRRELVKISESKVIGMILNRLAKQYDIAVSEGDIILDETARHTGENFTNEALNELIKSLNKQKVRLAYIQTPLQQLRTEMTFNSAFKERVINNEVEGISATVGVDFGSFGSKEELVDLAAGELLRIIIYSLEGTTTPEINGSGLMFDRIPLSVWTDITDLVEKSANSQAIKKRLKEELILKLKRNGETIFPSRESLIEAVQSKTSQEQFKAMQTFIDSVYSYALTADSTLNYYKNTISGRFAVWFMRNFNGEAKAGNYSDDQIIKILLAPKKEAKMIAAIAAGAITAERFLLMHGQYREASQQDKESYRTALDVLIAASKKAYEEAFSLSANINYAVRKAAESSVLPHKIWNARHSGISLTLDEDGFQNSPPVRGVSKLKIAAGALLTVLLISAFLSLHTQLQENEKELARLKAEVAARQAETEELYLSLDAEKLEFLFEREILSGHFYMPEGEEAFEKAKQASIAATTNEENRELIEETYERLAQAGITFKRKYTVFLIENEGARGAFTLPQLEVIFVSADVIDFENFTRDEIMANLAEIIGHEFDHIERRAADPSITDLELEYYAWDASERSRRAILGTQDAAGKEYEDISKAFGVIIEELDSVRDFIAKASEENDIEYMREDANLYYLAAVPNRAGEERFKDIVQVVLYDKNLNKPDYVLVCNVNIAAGEISGMAVMSYEEFTEAVKGILPENLDMVNEMAHKEKGAFLISAAITFKEFQRAVFHPVKFINMHPSKAGKTGAAIIVAATYAFAAAAALASLFIPAVTAAFFPLGIFAGVFTGIFSNAAAHIIIDYHYIKSSGLIDAVREFGSAAALTQEGYINLSVYVINERPENYSELGLQNTGVKLDGNTLWIGRSKGAVVLYADGVNQQDIVRELSSNRKINNIIKENASKASKKAFKNISVSFIEVDHYAPAVSVDYSENGNIRVSADLVKEAAKKGELADYSASLRRTQNIDASTFAKSVIHYLDDIKTLKEFEEYLVQHKEIGNGQIMISESLFNNIGAGIFSKFLAEAAKDGVQVYVLASETSNTAGFAAAGFAGYIAADSGYLYNFALGSSVKVKTGVFSDISSLEESMRNSDGVFVIENTLLKKALDSQRSAIGIKDLVEILTSVKILKVFRSRPLTEDSALAAARNFEIKDIPDLSPQNVEALKNLISAGNFSAEDFKSAMGIKENAADVISIYMIKLKTRADGSAAIEKAFMLGIIEKALAADILRKFNKEYGLKDRNHEIILGRALFDKSKYEIADIKPDITPDSFRTMREAEERLNGVLAGLMPEAFENKDAEALNAVIELIPAISEERRDLAITDNIKPSMDIRSYGSILSAA